MFSFLVRASYLTKNLCQTTGSIQVNPLLETCYVGVSSSSSNIQVFSILFHFINFTGNVKKKRCTAHVSLEQCRIIRRFSREVQLQSAGASTNSLFQRDPKKKFLTLDKKSLHFY